MPGDSSIKTGVHREKFEVAPVSSIWLPRLVEIDSSWNPASWSVKLFERELINPASRVRGLFRGDTLVGYLCAHVVMDEAHIVSLGIDPVWRRQGGGNELLRDFLRLCRLENVLHVTLEVRVSNQAAQALYAQAGFKAAGIRKHYYSDNGEDAITMRYTVEML